MHVYRLVRKKYPNALSGLGAARKGARWNSPGVDTDDASHVSMITDAASRVSMIIYTAGNRSLAMAEIAMHVSLATLPSGYFMHAIYIPDDTTIKEIQINDLPSGWNQFPHNTATQVFGDRFIRENTYCLLKVPSVVTKGDFNILINPIHAQFKNIRIIESDKFPFDDRIFNTH